jgi:hypothetical protein
VTTDCGAEIAASGPLRGPYPGYVQSEEEQQRWKLCGAIALAASMQFEPDGHAAADAGTRLTSRRPAAPVLFPPVCRPRSRR